MSCPLRTNKLTQTCTNEPEKTLPGPSNLTQLFFGLQFLLSKQMVPLVGHAFDKYGTMVKMRSIILLKGNEALRFLFTANPEVIQRQQIVGNAPPSLASMDGKEHMKHRQFVLQAFQKKWLLTYSERVLEVVLMHLEKWKQPVDLEHAMEKLSTDALLYSLLGLKPESQQFNEFLTDCKLVADRGPTSKLPNSNYQKSLRAQKRLWLFLEKLQQQRLQNPNNDAVTVLIEARKNYPEITDIQMLEYLYMIAQFGLEDVSSFLTSAVGVLASRPDIRSKLLKDIDQISPTNFGEIINIASLQNFIKEVERLYPPVPFVYRHVVSDCYFNGCRIPKNYKLLGSIYHTHRDPELFKNATEFNPSRYEQQSDESKEITAVMGFGNGPHMCPAKQYVYIQLAIILSVILKNWKFKNTKTFPEVLYKPNPVLKHRVMLETC